MYRALPIVFGLFLGGCDPSYGVSRGVQLEEYVNHRCLRTALDQVTEITDIDYRFHKGGGPLAFSGIQAPDQVHYYFFKTKGLNGYLYVSMDYKQVTELARSYGGPHAKPPQEYVDTIRPIMVKIEKEVEIACGIEGFAAKVWESCHGVRCDPLP